GAAHRLLWGGARVRVGGSEAPRPHVVAARVRDPPLALIEGNVAAVVADDLAGLEAAGQEARRRVGAARGAVGGDRALVERAELLRVAMSGVDLDERLPV